MHKSQSLFYLTTALHVWGVTIAHLQEHKTTVTTKSGNRYTILFSAAIVEELELISNSSTITHLQEHKTTVTTKSGSHYTVIDRVKFTDKEYR